MPIIKSAIKRMRQNAVRKARRAPFNSRMKTMIKKQMLLIKEGKVEEVVKLMPEVYSAIDTAVKKRLLPANTGARRKSTLARALNNLEAKGGKVTSEAPAKKKAAPKKAAAKKTTKKATKK